jgi:4-diphosphocytidyl-2-C-methyl-D-erythritol kinase
VTGPTESDEPTAEVTAPAKLTLSLSVTGVRPDGYHLLESEMVTLDLADTLQVSGGDRLTVVSDLPGGPPPIPTGPDNLVSRALMAVGRTAAVRLTKRIPPGAGLGGGSADAAAILRWAGRTDPALAAGLGADVPFCVHGGRAMVRGIGELVEELPFEPRRFVLALLPFGVDTAAVYRAWDQLAGDGVAGPSGHRSGGNDLEPAALMVEPRLGPWCRRLHEVTGVRPQLAGSGSTWFVAGAPEELGIAGRSTLPLGDASAVLVPVRTTPALQPAGGEGGEVQ